MKEYLHRTNLILDAADLKGIFPTTLINTSTISPKRKDFVLYIYRDYKDRQERQLLSLNSIRQMLGLVTEEETVNILADIRETLQAHLDNSEEWFDEKLNIPMDQVTIM
jgi:hypothetical protein